MAAGVAVARPTALRYAREFYFRLWTGGERARTGLWEKVLGSLMRRVNQIQIYRAGGRIAALRSIEVGDSSIRWMKVIGQVSLALDSFISDYKGTAPQSVERAQQLWDALSQVVKLGRIAEWTQPLTDAVWEPLDRFETSLEDELERLPTFVTEPVGAYSFGQLIGAGDSVFPKIFREGVIPLQALEDFREAGACLAFDVGTACGFHAFRATDAMLQTYCRHFGVKLEGNGRDWGKYIKALRGTLFATPHPNVRTIELLDAIRALDRNPLIHPEVNLTPDEALVIFDLCKNSISLMAMDIKPLSSGGLDVLLG